MLLCPNLIKEIKACLPAFCVGLIYGAIQSFMIELSLWVYMARRPYALAYVRGCLEAYPGSLGCMRHKKKSNQEKSCEHLIGCFAEPLNSCGLYKFVWDGLSFQQVFPLLKGIFHHQQFFTENVIVPFCWEEHSGVKYTRQ